MIVLIPCQASSNAKHRPSPRLAPVTTANFSFCGITIRIQEACDDELDYSVLDRHIEALDRMAKMSNSGVTIYDIHLRRHVFVSYNFPELFDCDKERIKRKALDAGPDMARYKLISEYRVNLGGNYVRVIEQQQVLETDFCGNVWLALSLLGTEQRCVYPWKLPSRRTH